MGKTKGRSKRPSARERRNAAPERPPKSVLRRWIPRLVLVAVVVAVVVIGESFLSLRSQSICGPSPRVAIENVSHPIRFSSGTITFTYNFTLNNSAGGAGVVSVEFLVNQNFSWGDKAYSISAGEVRTESETFSITDVSSVQGTLSPSVQFVDEHPNC